MSDFVTETRYDIARGVDGGLVLLLGAHPGLPDRPLVDYPGGDEPLLLRRSDQVIALPGLHPGAAPHLAAARSIAVVEQDESGRIVRTYNCPVHGPGADASPSDVGTPPPVTLLVAPHHDLVSLADDTPALVLDALPGRPGPATLVRTGAGLALLRRGPDGDQVVLLPGTPASDLARLAAVPHVTVLELAGDAVAARYRARYVTGLGPTHPDQVQTEPS